MASSASMTKIQEAYIAFYGRAADAAGQTYWADRYEAEGWDAVVDAFGNSAEATALYGAGGDEAQIQAIYNQMFGRDGDAEGVAFYTDLLTSGAASASDIAARIFDGATGDDATILSNKVAVADLFTAAAGDNYDNAEAARTFMSTVDKDTVAADADVDGAVAEQGSAGGADGSTFALTTGTDTITGTAADDAITGDIATLSTEATLTVKDVIDGGEGSDTLTASIGTNFAGFSTGSLKNVETVNLENSTAVARTFDATGVSGVEQYNLTGAITLSDVADLANVSYSGVAGTKSMSVTYASATVEGTADSVSLALTNVGTADDASTSANEENATDLTMAGVETLAVSATGTNVVDLGSASAVKTITADGTGSLKITNVASTVKSIDASAMSGNATFDPSTNMSSGTGIQTGSGNDKITVDSTDLLANATVAMGDGTDKLLINGGGATTTQYAMSGTETLELSGLGGALTVSLKNTTGLTDINLGTIGSTGTATAVGQNVTVTGGNDNYNLNLLGADANSNSISIDSTGSLTANVSTPTSSATTASPTSNNMDVTATGASDVTLNIDAKMSYVGTVTAAKASSITVVADGTLGTGSAINGAAATSVSVTNNNAAGDLDIIGAKITNITLANAKDLTLTGSGTSSVLAKLETLTASGKGDVNFTGVDMTALNSAVISNTGDIDLAILGASTQDYGVTVVATGGASTFTVEKILTNSQDVSVTVSNATGAVDFSDTTTSIDAGTGGNVTVNIDTTSTLAIDQITGKNVTLDMSGVIGATTWGGDINAAGDVDIAFGALTANALTSNNIVLTGTSQTINLEGGIAADTILIDGSSSQKAITVTGDLGIGTNSLEVASASSSNDQTVSISGISNYTAATVTTGSGTDTITGGAKADKIYANGQAANKADAITGGAGDDKFIFDAVADMSTQGKAGDRISDFNDNSDDDVIWLKMFSSAAAIFATAELTSTASITILDGSTFSAGGTVGTADFYSLSIASSTDVNASAAGVAFTTADNTYYTGALSAAIASFEDFITGLAFAASASAIATAGLVMFAELYDGSDHYLAIATIDVTSGAAAATASDVDIYTINLDDHDLATSDLVLVGWNNA
jgi:hypothetical protein